MSDRTHQALADLAGVAGCSPLLAMVPVNAIFCAAWDWVQRKPGRRCPKSPQMPLADQAKPLHRQREAPMADCPPWPSSTAQPPPPAPATGGAPHLSLAPTHSYLYCTPNVHTHPSHAEGQVQALLTLPLFLEGPLPSLTHHLANCSSS